MKNLNRFANVCALLAAFGIGYVIQDDARIEAANAASQCERKLHATKI